MSEKRFELIWETDEMCNVFDNDLDVNSTISVEDVVDLLNELHEENQSSKEFIEQLQEELRLFKNAGADMGIDLNSKITALKQENEQLQKEIQGFIKGIQESSRMSAKAISKGMDQRYEM